MCGLTKHQVISFSVGELDGKPAWSVELAVRRPWPLCWLDHRPWEKFERRCSPVRTFWGTGGLSWIETKDGAVFAVGGLYTVLNAVCAMESLKLVEPTEGVPKLELIRAGVNACGKLEIKNEP
jgi:hypothetical protein